MLLCPEADKRTPPTSGELENVIVEFDCSARNFVLNPLLSIFRPSNSGKWTSVESIAQQDGQDDVAFFLAKGGITN